MMKKQYIIPAIEFEDIELTDALMDLSKFETEGSGTTNDNNPEQLPWGGDTPGTDTEDDPNG